MVGKSTAWSMPSASMSARRATGSRPAGLGVGQRPEGRRVVEGRPGPGQGAQGDGEDLGAAHGHVLVAVRVGGDHGPVRVGQRRPGGQGSTT